MFSSLAPLARANPFYAPHLQLAQDGVRRRPEPAEPTSTPRRLAAASPAEGKRPGGWLEGGEGHGAGRLRLAATRCGRPGLGAGSC